ncbi:MAG: hypothetical protein WC836_16450 [Desulfobacula sp.]|jgi:5S rRNA maturation endonuclease (ribonuclease M5)
MDVIEFKTKIKNGNIRIPEKFHKILNSTVKVILITDQDPKGVDIIDKLLENPMKIENFYPFSRKEIYERV